MRGVIDRRFALTARATTPAREVLAGLTTFLAAAYLAVVIPTLLSGGGMDRGAATTATLLMLAAGSALMAFHANLPFIVGPGIGGSAIVGVTLAQVEGIAWPVGLTIAMFSGLLFLLLTLTGARTVVVRMIPPGIKLGLGGSIGIFIVMLGCRDAGMVAVSTKSPALMLGDFAQPGPIMAMTGLCVAIALEARRIPGAMLAGIAAAALAGVPLGVTRLPATPFAMPHSIAPVAFALDVRGALTIAALPYIFAFFAAEFFSTLGTTLAVGAKAGLTDAEGNLPRIERPFLVDSLAAALGPLVGIPAGTALIESAAGVDAGGRTGLTALSAALLFLAALLLTPLAMAIPRQATAPALILIGLSMLSTLRHLKGEGMVDTLAPFAMVVMTLLSNSFGTGIAAGILIHVAVQLLAGRARTLPPGLVILAVPLAYYLYTAATRH